MGSKEQGIVHNREISTIIKGAGIAFIGTIIGTGLKFFFELLIARQLGPQLFGIFLLGFSFYKILERLSTFGLHSGVLRYVSIYLANKDLKRVKGTIIISIKTVLFISLFIVTLIIVLSNKISTVIFQEIKLTKVLYIFAVAVIFTAITEILVHATLAFKTTKYKVITRMLFEPGIRILLAVIAIILGIELIGVTAIFTISIILGTGLAVVFLVKLFPEILNKNIKPIFETRAILSFSWPLFFVGFLNLIIFQVNILILGSYRESHEVGIYGAAFRTAFLIPIILESFNMIFAPIISELFIKSELKKLESLFKIVTKWIFAISFPIFLFMMFNSNHILALWGKEYIIGRNCLIILCVGQIVNCSVGSVGYMITMIGRSKLNLYNVIGVLFLNVVLSLILIPKYGIIGAALSASISLILLNSLRLLEVYWILKIHPYKKDFLKPLGAGVLSLMFVYFGISAIHLEARSLFVLFIVALTFIITYIIVLYFFGYEEEDLIIFNKIKSKYLRFSRR